MDERLLRRAVECGVEVLEGSQISSCLIEDDNVLNDTFEPIAPSGEPTARPGLYFIGFVHSLRGQLFESNRASRRLARNVARYLTAED